MNDFWPISQQCIACRKTEVGERQLGAKFQRLQIDIDCFHISLLGPKPMRLTNLGKIALIVRATDGDLLHYQSSMRVSRPACHTSVLGNEKFVRIEQTRPSK